MLWVLNVILSPFGMGPVLVDLSNPYMSCCLSEYHAAAFYLALLLGVERKFVL